MKRRRFISGLATAGAIGLAAGASGCTSLIPRAFADFDVPGRIAYIAQNDIYVWSQGNSTRLTKTARFEGPDWSPDGTQIAASLMGTNNSDIVILDASGKQLRQITKNFSSISIANQSWGRKPTWSPDGKRIAYICDNGPLLSNGFKSIDMSLFVVDPDGKNLKKLVVPIYFSGGVDWPTWSPDGNQIAFDHFEMGKTSQIYAYKIDTDRERALTSYADGAYAPAWSPDGQWIAFTRRDQSKNDIYVLPVAGGTPVKLTTSGANLAPAWSPDGSLLAYITQTVDAAADITVLKLAFSGGPSVAASKQITSGVPVLTTSGLSWTS